MYILIYDLLIQLTRIWKELYKETKSKKNMDSVSRGPCTDSIKKSVSAVFPETTY